MIENALPLLFKLLLKGWEYLGPQKLMNLFICKLSRYIRIIDNMVDVSLEPFVPTRDIISLPHY